MKIVVMSVIAIFFGSMSGFAWDVPSAPKAPEVGKSDPNAAANLDKFLLLSAAATKLMRNAADHAVEVVKDHKAMQKIQADRAAANKLTDHKERDAALAKVDKTEDATLKDTFSDDAAMKSLGNLDAAKKKELGNSLFNMGLAVVTDKELVSTGGDIASSASSNPSLVTKVGAVKDAISSLGDQADSGGSWISGMSKLAASNGVKVDMPTSSKATPKPL